MALIKITDDNDKKTTYSLHSYSISPCEEGLSLEISVPDNNVKYMIHPDMREGNIKQIESFISSLFDNALLNNKMIHLEEYLVRQYIFIGDGVELRRQFTAQKL